MSRFSFFVILSCGLFLLAMTEDQLIGTKAPEWNNSQWINSNPISVSQSKGKVILIRFFMESSCPFCRASAPHLNRFYEKYNDRGLLIVGMYTPKPQPQKTEVRTVEKYVKDYGFRFPIAVDDEWSTLNKFWLDRVPDADFTSVSFLIDKQGIIRYIHHGGSYSEKDASIIEKKIQTLLSE